MTRPSRKLTTQVAATLAGAVWIVATAMFGPALAEGLELRGAGSTFSAPLYEKWIAAFERAHPFVAVRYEAIGSGEGVARFSAGAVDFGGSDVPLSSAETAKIERGAIQVPSTAGMVVLAYNLPGVAGQLKLPQDVYVDIFMGRIPTWDDPRIRAANPGLSLPPRNIAVIARQDSSGTTFAFTSHLAAVSKRWTDEGPGVGKLVAWPQNAMIARGNEGVASRIKISEGAIGYVEFGFARRLGLPVALLQNKAGKFVSPTQETGTAALTASAGYGLDGLSASLTNPTGPQAYPIVTYTWLLLYENYPTERAQAITSFVDCGLNAGQALAADLGYLALPPLSLTSGKAPSHESSKPSSMEGDLAVLNLPAIETTLRDLQRAFPQINMGLYDQRDPLDDNVLSNMLEGYAMVDRLLCDGVDIFAMGQLHYWLELNTIVLCGRGAPVRTSHHRLIEATETRFYWQPDGGIRDNMDWYALNRGKSVWRRAAGVYIRILSDPQLFIEGNHRTGALIMSYLLAREGRAPFVLTDKNAREYFNPSSVFKKTNKRSVVMRLKMPGLTSALADYLKRQANKAFLVSTESSRAWTGDDPPSCKFIVGEDEP